MKIPTGSGVISNRSTSTGQVHTEATEGAVRSFSGAMDFVNKWKDQKDKATVQEAINMATRRTNDWKAQNLTRTGKDADGITEDYLRFSQELEGELSREMSNNAKAMFGQWSFDLTEQEKMRVIGHQHKETQKVKIAAFNDGVTLAEETIRTDARQWDRAFTHLNNSIELGRQSGVIPEEEYETRRTELTNRLRTELGKSYYTQDKHEFMKNINQFGFGKPEVEYYKEKYQRDLAAEEREKKSLFNEEAKLLYGQRDDMRAQAIANADASHFFAGAEKLRKMGYGEWAKNLEDEGKTYEKVIGFNEENKNKPLSEVVASAQSMKVPESLDGSSIEFKAMSSIKKEVEKQVKVFDSDPAQFVSAWQQGATMEEIASSRLSLQEQQGIIPRKGFQILTNEEKKTFKGAWEGGDIKQKTELVLNSLRYGKHAPAVLGEVGVNSTLSMATLMNDEKDIEMLVAGVSHKPEVLEDGSTRSDYTGAAKGSKLYELMLEVQSEFPTNDVLPQRIKDLEKAMTGISARNVNPNAGRDFFDERLEVLSSGDKKIYFPSTVDEDEVEFSLDERKTQILTGLKTGDKLKDKQVEWALRDAMWVNTDRGFALMDPRSGAFVPGSEMDMLELDTLRRDLVRSKAKEAEDLVTQTFKRR